MIYNNYYFNVHYTFFTEKWDSKKCIIAPDLTG